MKGEKTRKILEDDEKYCAKCDSPWSYYTVPPVFERAKGSYVFDTDKKRYLDFVTGYSSVNFGHCHPKIVSKVREHVDKLTQLHDMITPARVELAKKLVDYSGIDGKVYFDVGGSNAIDVTMKFAMAYTKRNEFLSFHGGFHGRTLGALSLTAGYNYKRLFKTDGGNVTRVPYPYCYRCFYSKEYPECGMHCVSLIEKLFESKAYGIYDPKSRDTSIAAVYLEPAQGVGGYIFPPNEFFPRIRELCDNFNLLMVDDEIQLGFGRTGKMFAYEHYKVKPDLVALAKSLAGSVWPLAAIIGRKEVMDSVPPGTISATFASNPLGVRMGLETMLIMEEEKLCEKSEKSGKYLLKALKELEEDSRIVGIVDGKGLAIGIEFVEDKETKKPAPERTFRIVNDALEHGLLLQKSGYYANRLNIAPPLNVSKEEMDEGVNVLRDVIKENEK